MTLHHRQSQMKPIIGCGSLMKVFPIPCLPAEVLDSESRFYLNRGWWGNGSFGIWSFGTQAWLVGVWHLPQPSSPKSEVGGQKSEDGNRQAV
jgi:hypothetical protein